MSLLVITGCPELELQPLDKSHKTVLKQCFIDWYGAKVKDALDKGEVETIPNFPIINISIKIIFPHNFFPLLHKSQK